MSIFCDCADEEHVAMGGPGLAKHCAIDNSNVGIKK